MDSEIKKRKKRFLTFCLVLVLGVIQLNPVIVFSATYNIQGSDYGGEIDAPDSLVLPGDVVNYNSSIYNVSDTTVYYLDSDDKELYQDSVEHTNTSTETKNFTVSSYSEVSGVAMPEEQFKAWEVTEIEGSGGCPSSIRLKAVAYIKSNINYELDGGTNAAANPTTYYEGKEEIILEDAYKSGYIFEGWYCDTEDSTIKVTSISTTQTGDITLYAKFILEEVELEDGTGTITIDNIHYGETLNPILTSDTNGTEHVTIEYKKMGADDSSYTTECPVNVGDYTARATFAATEQYSEAVATDDFSISYLDKPKSPYTINGTAGENNYYTSAVEILPAAGYLIADSLDGTYKDKLEVTKSSDGFFVYLMKVSTGGKTSGIKISAIKIDNTAPVILNVPSEKIIYGDKAEVIIKDDNLSQVLVNGEKAACKDGKAVLQLYSNQGEEKYKIIGKDSAGNKSEMTLVVAADWMKTKIVPSGVNVKLFKKYSYTLGNGTWKVNGDTTTYTGDATFYVNSDGEYSFSKVN